MARKMERHSNTELWARLNGWELFSGTFEGTTQVEYLSERKAKLWTPDSRWLGTIIRTEITSPTDIT